MLLLRHGPVRSGTACLLVTSTLVLACSSDDTSSGDGPNAGTNSQAGSPSNHSAGGSSTQGGATTTESGGSSGTSTATTAGGGTTSGTSCSQASLVCKMAAPNCATMQVAEMTDDGSCYTGSCIPIAECTCATASDCPDASQYTCNVGTGHCTPYLL